jgi:hypothetical protein
MSKTPIKQRDYKTSEFIKTIGLTLEHYNFIDRVRAKKSRAGFLKMVIDLYANQANAK